MAWAQFAFGMSAKRASTRVEPFEWNETVIVFTGNYSKIMIKHRQNITLEQQHYQHHSVPHQESKEPQLQSHNSPHKTQDTPYRTHSTNANNKSSQTVIDCQATNTASLGQSHTPHTDLQVNLLKTEHLNSHHSHRGRNFRSTIVKPNFLPRCL